MHITFVRSKGMGGLFCPCVFTPSWVSIYCQRLVKIRFFSLKMDCFLNFMNFWMLYVRALYMLVWSIYFGFYGSMEPWNPFLGGMLGRCMTGRSGIHWFSFVRILFIGITCLVSACTWSHVPMFLSCWSFCEWATCYHLISIWCWCCYK